MATTSEQVAADKEAHEYWGYLFKPDKTGTDKFKNLLRGLHQLIVGLVLAHPCTVLMIHPGQQIRALRLARLDTSAACSLLPRPEWRL